jgi:hypothetical protein
MAQYIDKVTVVAEIDRLQEATMDKNQNFLSSYHEGIFDGLSMLENFLDTLEVKEIGVDLGDPQGDIGVKWVQEEPTSNDLEAEFVLYLKHKFNIPQEGHKLKTNGWRPSPYDILDIAKHFAQWQKTKACEWLKEHEEHPFIGCEDPCLSGYLTDEFIDDFKKAMEE